MSLRQNIINNVGANNLFRLQDIDFVKKSVLKSLISRWSKIGDIKKYRNGCYYFASYHKIGNKVFYNDSFNFYNFVKQNYLLDRNGHISGIEVGQNYLTSHNIDTQISTKHIVYTNNLKCRQKIYKVDTETFVIRKSKVNINSNNANYLALLYTLSEQDFLDFNNRLYDDGAWDNRESIDALLELLDKNTIWYWAEQFTSKTRERLKKIYDFTQK